MAPPSEGDHLTKLLSTATANIAALTAAIALVAWLGYFYNQQRLLFFGHVIPFTDKWWQSPLHIVQGVESAIIVGHYLIREFGGRLLLSVVGFVVLLRFVAGLLAVRDVRLVPAFRGLVGAAAALFVVYWLLMQMTVAIRLEVIRVAQAQLWGAGCTVGVIEVNVALLDAATRGASPELSDDGRRVFLLLTTEKAHLLYSFDRRARPGDRQPLAFAVPSTNGVPLPVIRRSRTTIPASVPEAECY